MTDPIEIREVVATSRGIQGLLGRSPDAGQRGLAADAMQAGSEPRLVAARLTQLNEALRELEKATAEADPDVMVAPRNRLASLIQSWAAARAAETGEVSPLPTGGREVKFQEGVLGADPAWAQSLWHMIQRLFEKEHEIVRPSGTKPDRLPDAARLAVFGDWGTGMYGAPATARSIQREREGYSVVLHLGDVYYSGTEDEVRQRFLELWPHRPDAVNRALNANHEMYSGGFAYFDLTLEKFAQPSSYFTMENDHWTLVALDTAHTDHDMDEQQVKWLRRVVEGAEDRKVILFSHHQLYSLLGEQGEKLAKKLRQLLTGRKIFAWYWGHEHRCLLYDQHSDFGLHARCLGHGGIPYVREAKHAPVETRGNGFEWRRVSSQMTNPSALLLDGPNPYVPGKEEKFGPQGYMTLELAGPHLNEIVHLPDGTRIWERQLA